MLATQKRSEQWAVKCRVRRLPILPTAFVLFC
jgi:hypothetical protein